VLRDAYMSGYSTRAFDLARLLHYSQFTERGLTIHERGLSALVRFISVRAETVPRHLLPPHGSGNRPGTPRKYSAIASGICFQAIRENTSTKYQR